MALDYDKIFAQSGLSSAPSDSEYLQGFAFLGSNPPTYKLFNYIHQNIDLKLQNLFNASRLWRAGKTYATGDVAYSTGLDSYQYVKCITAGTSGTTEPIWPVTGSTVADGTVLWKVCSLHVDNAVPAGTYLESARASAPEGYLSCDGHAVSRTTYADLFTAIGTIYGAGDGSTTFNLPNRGGRFPLAKGGNYTTLGATGGEATHTLTINEMPNHSHSYSWFPGEENGEIDNNYQSGHTLATGTTGAIGGGQAHNNMPPYFVVNYYIKY